MIIGRGAALREGKRRENNGFLEGSLSGGGVFVMLNSRVLLYL